METWNILWPQKVTGSLEVTGHFDLLYDPKIHGDLCGLFDIVMTQKGHGVIRSRLNLLYDPKGHGDLYGQFDLVYEPKRSRGH